MFGNTAWLCLRERAPWFIVWLGMIGAPLLLAADSNHSPLLNVALGTTPRHFEVLLTPSTVSARSENFSPPAFRADTVRGVGLAPTAVDREAAAGHALYYTFSVSNLGNVDDEYALATAGHRWPVTLLRADSAVKILKTDAVAAGKQFQFVIRIDVPGNARIGASDTARIFVRSLAAPAVNDVSSFITISLGPTGSLPWIEPFAAESRKQVPWRYNTRFPFNFGPVEVDDEAVNAPSSRFALHFDGDAKGGDEVRSQPINLLGKSDAVLQFAYERGGAGNAPENGEDLSLDYFNADGEWIKLLDLPGSGAVTASFSMESVILPRDAYHSSFRFRFRNVASVGPFDDWYLDDVRIFEVTRGRIPFIETFPLLTLDADKWPVGSGVRVDTLGRNEPGAPFSANLQGNSLLQTQPLDLARESAVSVRYYFQQGGFGDEPEAGDDLFVEFFDRSGAWQPLAQHLGVDGGLPNFTRREAFLPPTAYHRDFRLRFRSVGDPGFDDWFIDDVAIEVFLPPEIEVTPATLAAKIFAGDSTTKELAINNAGPGELFYRLRVAPPASAANNAKGVTANIFSAKYPQNFYQLALKKNEPDWRAGQSLVLSRGGPDIFGYTWRDSRETDGPAFQWTDIATTGKLIPGVGDDDNVGPFRLGFAFPFYDSVFTSFQFCTNGFISFTGAAAPFTNDPLPSGGVANLVAPFWDDLDLTGGAAYYLAGEKQLIVQWTNARSVSGNGVFTFQLILTPKGNIVFQYLRLAGAVNFSTIGIQNSDGSEGLEVAFNTDFARDSLAVLIERPSSWLSFSPNNGRLGASNATVQIKFNAAGLQPDSTYHTELRVESNDLDEPLVPVAVALQVLKRKTDPEHFDDFDTTKIKYVVNIDQATLNDQPLEIGDEIGVFTPGGLLAGAAIWNAVPQRGTRLIAYGDDSSTAKVEGFTRGQTMFFRIWQHTGGNRDYPATPTYSRGDGRFGTGDSARISLLAAQTRFARRMTLNPGWSWISFNVMPDTLDVVPLLDSLRHLAIISNGNGDFYIPGQFNGIGTIDVLQGYKIYLNAPDSLKFTGEEVLPNTPIPLRQGWNFVSFLPTAPVNAEAALAGVSQQLALAKNDAGGFYIPNLINTLGSMQPGGGYRLYMNAADTLVYPFGARARAKAAARIATAIPLAPQHFKPPGKTGESYSLVILAAAVNGKPLQAGDEIGVFAPAGKLAGAGVWPENGPLGLAVWRRDDDDAPTDNALYGFVPGEKMIFRAWRRGGFEERPPFSGGFPESPAAEEIAMPANFLRGNGTFDSDVFAIVELAANPPERGLRLPQKFQLRQSFPNPVRAAPTVIRYELPQPGFVELRVYNLLGQAVRTLHQAALPAGFHEIAWDGRDDHGRLAAAGVYLYRLHVLGDRKENIFTAVRKVVVVP